jgi:hypothetical protein
MVSPRDRKRRQPVRSFCFEAVSARDPKRHQRILFVLCWFERVVSSRDPKRRQPILWARM